MFLKSVKSLFLEGVSKLKEKARRRKGRGFEEKSKRNNIKDEAMEFDSVDQADDDGPGPQRCNFHKLYIFDLLLILFKFLHSC